MGKGVDATMTAEDINQRLIFIESIKGDDEAAHSAQDKLYREFVEYVAELSIPIADKAKLVLKVENIEFERWCA